MRLFIVGDSISIDYAPRLREHLEASCFTYARKNPLADSSETSITGQNGGDSRMVLSYLRELPAADASHVRDGWLVVNCGLHDIKRRETGTQVPIHEYAENLAEIVRFGRNELGAAKVVWVRTTPVDDAIHDARGDPAFSRRASDVAAFNAAADDVCAQLSVPTIDLHGMTAAVCPSAFRDHVHYEPRVCDLQARFLALALRRLRDDDRDGAEKAAKVAKLDQPRSVPPAPTLAQQQEKGSAACGISEAQWREFDEVGWVVLPKSQVWPEGEESKGFADLCEEIDRIQLGAADVPYEKLMMQLVRQLLPSSEPKPSLTCVETLPPSLTRSARLGSYSRRTRRRASTRTQASRRSGGRARRSATARYKILSTTR